MKYIMTLFWSFILGHVVYYLGSSLTSALPEGSYDLLPGTILGLSIAVAVIIIAHIMKPKSHNSLRSWLGAKRGH